MSTGPETATRIVILGGGFGGLYTTLHLQRHWKRDPRVRVTLVSRDNYFIITPLLFEAGSGVLEPRHAVAPIRPMLSNAELIQAEVLGIDFDARRVRVQLEDADAHELEYDHLVIALGGVTNTSLIEGSAENAMQFKTLRDAMLVRNHVIQRFEHADVEPNPAQKRAALTFAIIGAGFVGVELTGELTDFLENVARVYPHVRPDEIRIELIEAGPRIAPEFDPDMSEYAMRVLRKRGVNVRISTKVNRIEPRRIHLENGEVIDAHTIVLATGTAAAPTLKSLNIPKNAKGRIPVDAMMRVADFPGVWAIGDCASIPSPSGKPYPQLAQHALREARVLAANITAIIRGQGESALKPFVYETIGLLAALGRYKGVGRIKRIRVKGFLGWWVWRSYYLFQMPRWSRRIRIMIDWTVALFFKNDVVQLDMLPDPPKRM